jgi:hypothetical protein
MASEAKRIETMVLIDSPMDGFAEERGWVPVTLAETPEQAEAVMAKEVECIDSFLAYKATGKCSFQRPVDHAEGDGAWFVFEDNGPETYDDDRPGHWSEYLPWEKCEADAPGAVEFWDIEVVERETNSAN